MVSAPITDKHLPLVKNTYPEEPVGNFKLCSRCKVGWLTSLDGAYTINTLEDFKFIHK